MTKDEIKKALSTCAEVSCDGCPYTEHMPLQCCYSCSDKLKLDACALITEQDKEIEQLKANGYRSIMDAFENNRDKIVENIQTEIDDYKQSIKQAEIEVLNELKTRHDYAIKNMGYPWDISQQIDELIKEIE